MTPDARPPASAADILARTTAAALAVSSVEGATLFNDLARRLAEILEVDAAVITVFSDSARTRLQALAAWVDGKPLNGFEYALADTPCRRMVGRESRFVAAQVRPEFTAGTPLAAFGFDSYAAHSLLSATGEQMGVVAALDRRPMADEALTVALLKIFATRAATEIERSRAEQSWRGIFDATEDAIFVHEWETGTILDVSAKATDLFGYPRETLKKIRIGEISANVPPYTEADALAHIERAKVSPGPLRIEWRARHRDGHLMWHEVILKQALIAGQRRVLASVRDITELKTAADALQMRERQYRAIFDGSADAMVLWDADLRKVDVNHAFLQMYGFEREEVIGRTFDERMPQVDVEQRIERIRWALAGRESTLETETLRKNGERFDVELRYLPILHMGRAHALAIARDITARKAAEAALRDSEAQYRAIFEAATDSLQLLDARHRVVDVNRAYERMYGKRRDDVVGKGLEELVPAPFRAERLALIERALAGEAAELLTTGFRMDGTAFDLEVRCIPFEHGGQPHVLGIARDITARKAAEAALRASEAQYRAIFDASDDALILWNSQYQRVDVNPAYERLYGWTRDEVMGRGFEVFSSDPDQTGPRRELVTRALAGETCRAELEGRRKDGRRIEVEVHTIPFSHRGQPHVLAIARDITERKRAEDALRASEARYRLLFDTESDALVLVDVATLQLLDVNQAAVHMYGRSREELLGMTAADLSAEPQATWQSIQQAEGALKVPARLHRRADGRIFPVEIMANRLLLDGRMTLLAAIRDISERREREEALRRSEARMRATIETALDCVIGMDRQGRIIEFNAAAERCFGYQRAQVLGRVLAEVIVPPRHRDAHAAGLAHHQRTGEGPYIGRRVEAAALRADGTEFPVEITVSEAESSEGRIYVGYVRDLTAQRRAEEEHRRLEAQLRQAQKMEAIGQLAGGIAHDFNNILTSIMGYIVLAQEDATERADEKAVAQLDHAAAGCRRARDLVRKLLTFARGQRARPEPLELCRLVRDAVPLLRASLPSTIALECDCDGQMPPALADRVQVDQVLLNLVLNARDAIGNSRGSGGGGRIRLAVGRQCAEAVCSGCRQPVLGEFVAVEVEDDGPGMSASVTDRVFEPFFSTKAPSSNSGMGLAMVHGIVHEHGGHVLLQTQPGEGARFTVLLPLAPPGLDAVQPAPDTGRIARARLRGRVLVVDDDPTVREFLNELLTAWGTEVDCAADGEAAWTRLQAQRYDLVLSDQTMPVLDGLGLAHRITTLGDPPPVLLMSGLATLMEPQLRAAGIHSLLPKPLEPQLLRAELERHLSDGPPPGRRAVSNDAGSTVGHAPQAN